MVRAAASGAIDYSRADPKDIYWRIRHRLVIKEMQRRNDEELFQAVHRHWLAFIAHGRLTEESYDDVRKRVDDALLSLQGVIYPWVEVNKPEAGDEGQKDTIKPVKPETRALIDRFKRAQARWRQEAQEEQGQA
jgi:hypothetical protein